MINQYDDFWLTDHSAFDSNYIHHSHAYEVLSIPIQATTSLKNKNNPDI